MRRRLCRVLLCLATLAGSPLMAQNTLNLMPVPAHLEIGTGQLVVDSGFQVGISGYSDARLEAAVERTLVRLERRLGIGITRVKPKGPPDLTVEVQGPGQKVQTPEEDESYTLTVTPQGAILKAPTVVGALRGFETIIQLLAQQSSGFYLPAVSIADAPRFPWRGLLVDVCRHWQPVDVIRRTLDGMAAVKLNVLHWHLSEDQGFRVESKKFPRLQELGSDGNYYTQEEIGEVVAYARARGIRVVPEFDMPGHTTSWFVGYPEFASAPGPYSIERKFGVFDPTLDPTRDEVYRFIEEFIDEIAPLFPDPYWHIGGDEVTGRQWNSNIRIQKFMRTNGLRTNDALQAYFNGRLEKILEQHGKLMVGWDEILQPDLPKTAVVQSWRGVEYLSQAARSGYQGILSAPYYLDHIKSAEDHYMADPLPVDNPLTAEEAARVLGGEACMWGEHISPETIDSRIWPRVVAVAERLWSPASVRDVDDMYRRLSITSLELEGLGLTHEAHTYRMIRLLTGARGVGPLHDLLQYLEPVSFSQRYRLQGTTQLTPLTRLPDAARPDPWARSRLNRLARQALNDPRGPAADSLRAVFTLWRELPARYAVLADVPLARDGDLAVATLSRLGTVGMESLDRLTAGAPANPDWAKSVRTFLDSASGPQGLVRVVGVQAVAALARVQ
ncbi:MAG TPA: family 20 glycosylhydrolase [Gemmatimonadales bacterium]|nr:family 20 glycosylhydrolase [Gemmatimonadales bacterium]